VRAWPCAAETLRKPGAAVIGFVGRLARDKGIEDLAAAWQAIRDEFPGTVLLLVGPWADTDPVSSAVREALESDPRVLLPGRVEQVAPFYRAMQLFVFPSYGEGFPNAPMEAAAMKLPVVATDVVGCTDAVEHGQTGLLVAPRSPASLANAIRAYLRDPALGRRHGEAGRIRVVERFRREPIWEALHQEYLRLLAVKGLRVPTGDQCGTDAGPSAQTGAVHSYKLALKRLMDLLTALVGLIVLSPLYAVIAVLIRLTLGPPVLFRQRRPGLNEKPFTLRKFRTMRLAWDRDGQLLPDSQRLTPLGRLLRATSLDELPQLWNVLRGDMSLVGPRPLLMQYLARYTPEQRRRHAVRPGITGLAQVNGRRTLPFSERFRLDVWYVDHWSLWLDFKILCRTFLKVLCATGVRIGLSPEEEDDLGLYTEPEVAPPDRNNTSTPIRPAGARVPLPRHAGGEAKQIDGLR